MNTNLIGVLMTTHGYCLDRIEISYDIMPCEYQVEISLTSQNQERVIFQKSYEDDKENLVKFGRDIEAIGKLITKMSEKEN